MAIENGPRDISTEIVTKIVPVRAVHLSIEPFCTEFQCERFCDDDVFWDWGREIDRRVREIDRRVREIDRRGREIDRRVGKSTVGIGKSNEFDRFCLNWYTSSKQV